MRRTIERRHDSVLHAQLITARLATVSNDRYLAIAGHVEQMGAIVEASALALGFTGQRARMLRAASALHDIGKAAIPDAILLKRGPLTPSEWTIMRRHTLIGHELLAHSGDETLDLAATLALAHHERWDGCGYPQRLRRDEIPLEARIAAVADVFDALTKPRPYRDAIDEPSALEIVISGSGTHFDPCVVAALVAVRSPTSP